MEKFTVTVIGAGIVGLAVAARLAPKLGPELLLVEQQPTFGQETSSRNSEVVHAGIYYPENSLKARLCVKGRRQIYELCRKHSIAHRKLSKIIVATDSDEEQYLADLLQRGQNNGVEKLKFLTAREVQAREPQVKAKAALISPETGIVDSYQLMQLFYLQAKAAGTTIAFNSKITNIITTQNADFLVQCESGVEKDYKFQTKIIINCAGLGAMSISKSAAIPTPEIHYAKGCYFSYHGQSPVTRLVYPAPPATGHGLGIHATLDLGGRLRFGPDLEYCTELNYQISEHRQPQFAAAIKRYLPNLDPSRLFPEMAGIRPRLQGPNDSFRDFIIREEHANGAPGFINLLGIESPGLTAAPAIADEVNRLIAL